LVTDRYLNWLLSLIYAFLFVYVIPWVDLNGGEFLDIQSYLEQITYIHEGGKEAEVSGIQLILHEPLWRAVVIFIGDTFTNYRDALYIISFFTVFVYTSFLIKRVEFYIAMIFLINPMMVNLFIEQVRSVFAFSIVLIAYDLASSSKERYPKLPIALFVVASLIHASMPLFYLFYYILYRYNSRIQDYKYYFIALVFGLFIALFMKYGITYILTMLGDRHANYDEYIAGASIAYSIAWMVIASILGTFGDFSNRDRRVVVAYSIMIMSYFFFASALGIFATRFVALIMPFIIISIGYLPKHIKQWTYLFLLLYNIYSFKYWFQFYIL